MMFFSRVSARLTVVLLLGAAGVLEALAQGGPGIFDRGPPRHCDSFDHCLQRCNAKGGTGGTDIGCATLCTARNCTNPGGNAFAPAAPAAGAAPAADGATAAKRPKAGEACKDLPPGPAKAQCAQRANPDMFTAKQGHCMELAQQQGLADPSPRKKDFMQSCMQGTAASQ